MLLLFFALGTIVGIAFMIGLVVWAVFKGEGGLDGFRDARERVRRIEKRRHDAW